MSSRLILASGSPYRRALLERLRVPFEIRTAGVDETPAAGERPESLVSRLAMSKAAAVAQSYPDAWVIGSDQAAICDGRIVGKPGNAERCRRQLQQTSSRAVTFLTAVCLLRAGQAESGVDATTVRFRTLEEAEIARYVDAEQPFDCAGGFKVEGLGITLFECIESRDPTALIGLPLIWLSAALRRAGFTLP